MTIEQLFGTLQQSVVDMWRSHLETDKYSAHMALDDYYKDMPELIDTLIENYMGRYGRVFGYESSINPKNYSTPAEYLTALRDFVSSNRESLLKTPELQSDCDAILSLIDSTIYKLKELTESAAEEITWNVDENVNEGSKVLIEACKGCKEEDEEEQCKNCKKKKHIRTAFDKEEECELKEHISLSDFLLSRL